MANQIDAAVELRIPDNTAFTVLTTLRHLGYEELQRVERSEHFMLSVEDSADPEAVMRQLARVELVFNPNKHRLSYATAESPPASPPQFEALVRDRDENNDRLVALIAGTFGVRSLRGLTRAVGWRLYDSEPAGRERLEWACRALLANTVSQIYDIHPRLERCPVGESESTADPVGESEPTASAVGESKPQPAKGVR